MEGFFTMAEPREGETPAESADKVRPHNANLDLKREEAHWPPAASENFPKLGQTGKRDFFSRKQLFMVREGRLRFSYRTVCHRKL
jgi:hypothetical protein